MGVVSNSPSNPTQTTRAWAGATGSWKGYLLQLLLLNGGKETNVWCLSRPTSGLGVGTQAGAGWQCRTEMC